MTEREIALYETLKILINQMISSGLLDYTAVRRTLESRERTFCDKGLHQASQMMATIKFAVEPKRVTTVSPHPFVAAETSPWTEAEANPWAEVFPKQRASA